MNREEARKILEWWREHDDVVEHYVNGGDVQLFGVFSKAWIDAKKPFDTDMKYRIKPEPKYRPFTAEEAVGYIGRQIVKENGWSTRIHSVGKDCFFYWCGNEMGWLTFEKAIDWKFTESGTPCGVLVEETYDHL